jgi:hypothetical protein
MSTTKPPASYEDKFVVPLEPSRRGAHRARVSSLVSALPVLAVLAVVTVVIVLTWKLFGNSTVTATGTARPAPPSQTQSAVPGSAVSASASAPATASPTTAAPSATQPTQAVDKTLPIGVMNSSGIAGLAARAATKLEGDGWTIDGTPGNVRPARPTTVYYATTKQKETAQAVLTALGGTYRLRHSAANAGKGITVVLGSDYRP